VYIAAESEASSRTTVLSFLLTVVIGVVLVSVVFYLTQRNLLIRQRMAEAIAEQRERLRVTLASIGDAVITTDVEGCIAYLNAVAESLTGWPQAEAVSLATSSNRVRSVWNWRRSFTSRLKPADHWLKVPSMKSA
jgi:PAS domain-containing protein